MDAEVGRRLKELIEAIHAGEEYRQFEESKKKLNADPEKRRKADEFRRRNFQLQNSDENDNTQAQVAMYHEREELRRDEVIDTYLNSELVICRLLRQVSLRVMECADLELESMEDLLS